jgi:hypothetical protein
VGATNETSTQEQAGSGTATHAASTKDVTTCVHDAGRWMECRIMATPVGDVQGNLQCTWNRPDTVTCRRHAVQLSQTTRSLRVCWYKDSTSGPQTAAPCPTLSQAPLLPPAGSNCQTPCCSISITTRHPPCCCCCCCCSSPRGASANMCDFPTSGTQPRISCCTHQHCCSTSRNNCNNCRGAQPLP